MKLFRYQEFIKEDVSKWKRSWVKDDSIRELGSEYQPHEMLEYVTSFHDQDGYDDTDFEERVNQFEKFVLKMIDLSDLDLDEFQLDYYKVDEYVEDYKNEKGEYPAIVVGEDLHGNSVYGIIDGLHRANAFDKMGKTQIKAYVGVGTPDYLNESYDKNEWLSKYKLPSDNIRYYYLQKAKFDDPSNEKVDEFRLTDTWDGYDDLVFVKNRGNHIDFYEGFVESCWIELYKKPEYKGLDKEKAVDKMITDRFGKISDDLNLSIGNYTFENNILHITFRLNEINESNDPSFGYEDEYVTAKLNERDGTLEILEWESKYTEKGGTEKTLRKLRKQYPIIYAIDTGYEHEDSFKYWTHMLDKGLINGFRDDNGAFYDEETPGLF